MIGKVENLSKHHPHMHTFVSSFLIRTIIPPSRDNFEIEPSKVRRGKTKEKKLGKKKNTKRRQCATRVKIISAKIEEEENHSPRIPAESFYSQHFVDVTSIGTRKQEIK